jgi:PAS domain-containing protein
MSDAARRDRELRRTAGMFGDERWFRSVVENATEVVTILEADGTVRYVSPAIERVLGYRPEERAGNPAYSTWSIRMMWSGRWMCWPGSWRPPGSTRPWSSGSRTRTAPGATWSTWSTTSSRKDPRSTTIVKAMISPSHSLGLEAVGEGWGAPRSWSTSGRWAATSSRVTTSQGHCRGGE